MLLAQVVRGANKRFEQRCMALSVSLLSGPVFVAFSWKLGSYNDVYELVAKSVAQKCPGNRFCFQNSTPEHRGVLEG